MRRCGERRVGKPTQLHLCPNRLNFSKNHCKTLIGDFGRSQNHTQSNLNAI